METESPMMSSAMAELREEIDTKLRFKKVVVGFDPRMVDDFLLEQKKAIERLQESLEEEKRTHAAYRSEAESELDRRESHIAKLEEQILSAQMRASALEENLSELTSKTAQADEREKELLARQEETIRLLRTSTQSELNRRESRIAELEEQLSSAQMRASALEENLPELRSKTAQADEREKELLTKQEEDAKTISQLRASMEMQNLMRMRIQLMAAIRECSECSARCLTLKQEKKQLSERVEALAEECRILSDELTEEKNHNQVLILSAGRDVTRMRTLTRMIFLDVHARLNEAAGSISGFLEENEALASRIDEYLTGRGGNLSANSDEELADKHALPQ